MTKIYYPGLAESCRRMLEKLLPDIRETAREHGYAVGIHGSTARDIDLIAVPWVGSASNTLELAEAIRLACEKVNGLAFYSPSDTNPVDKPHGRMCWSIHLGSGVYIDLSVMPRSTPND